MHEAEKEAKAIIDDEKHSNYHEEKSHMIKQEEENKQQEMTSIANENAAKKERKAKHILPLMQICFLLHWKGQKIMMEFG